MSMPTIPNINPEINIVRDDAVNIIIASIAMEELALAHILNAEGEKLQYVLGTLEGRDTGEVTICDIMAVNNSIHKTLRDIIKQEMLLQLKLEDAIELAENASECQLTIRGQKIWRDGNNVAGTRPAAVEIHLLRDEVIFRTIIADAADDWAYTFACLPVWRDSANRYTYRVDEAVVSGYIKTVSGYNITNTVEEGSITINGSIIWDDFDNDRGDRPASTTVTLLRNGVAFGNPTTVDSPAAPENTATFSFSGVPQFDGQGNPYVYTVDTANITNYRKIINGYDITNAIEIRTVAGTKIWANDSAENRPTLITINLLQNGTIVDTRDIDDLTADDMFPFSFDDVPRFDDQGAEFVYTVDEELVPDYSKSIDQTVYEITNTFTL